ncbi:MAG TPA: hypothetical protein VH744_07300 [Terriglobales bacterium]
MRDEDLLKCPLLQGLDGMHRAELIGLLKDSAVRQNVENCVARLHCVDVKESKAQDAEPAREFESRVHSWNRDLPLWRRSPKE